MMRSLAAVVVLILTSCGTLDDPVSREALALDIEDALSVIAPHVGGAGAQWLDAVRAVVAAVRDESEGEFGLDEAFAAVEATEPAAVAALIESGRTAEEAETLLLLVRIGLRRLRASTLATR